MTWLVTARNRDDVEVAVEVEAQDRKTAVALAKMEVERPGEHWSYWATRTGENDEDS